jgi:hypothetical protein
MFSPKSKQLYRTTSSPAAISSQKQALHTTILENEETQVKISQEKVNAIKSQKKAEPAFVSIIALGANTSSAVIKELQTITSTLNNAMKWTGELQEVISQAPNQKKVNVIITEHEIPATKSQELSQELEKTLIEYFCSSLANSKREAQKTMEDIAHQTSNLTPIMTHNVTETVRSANIALEAATITATKTAIWFHMAAKAESQGMITVEALASFPSTSQESKSSKEAAWNTAIRVIEAQTSSEIWHNLKDRTRKTITAWAKATDAIKRTTKTISKVAPQTERAFHAIDSIDKSIGNMKEKNLKDIVTFMKSITSTIASVQATIAGAIECMKECECRMERIKTCERRMERSYHCHENTIADIPKREVI